MTAEQAFPGATGVTLLDVYDWPTADGLRGGSAHIHLASTEGYVVLRGAGRLQTLGRHGFQETPHRAARWRPPPGTAGTWPSRASWPCASRCWPADPVPGGRAGPGLTGEPPPHATPIGYDIGTETFGAGDGRRNGVSRHGG